MEIEVPTIMTMNFLFFLDLPLKILYGLNVVRMDALVDTWMLTQTAVPGHWLLGFTCSSLNS